jgi:RNA polymerase primary sigma factor
MAVLVWVDGDEASHQKKPPPPRDPLKSVRVPKKERKIESRMRRTRELKQELEVPHEGASEVFFKYQEVSRARSGDILAESIDESLSLDIEPLESAAPPAPVESKHDDVPVESGPKPLRGSEAPGAADSKSTDPVRIYLRRIGSVALLTREGEVELAKRMEEGELAILTAILNSPALVREILKLGEDVRSVMCGFSDIME